MPDMLAGLDAAQKGDVVEALVHYVSSIAKSAPTNLPFADTPKMQQGRLLFHQVGCVACHVPQDSATLVNPKLPPSTVAPADWDLFYKTSSPLSHLGRKTTVSELARFLMDPLKVRPSGRMPSLNLTEPEATAIAMYLLRGQSGDPKRGGPRRSAGVGYEYFEGNFNSAAKFDPKRLKDSGVVDGFKIESRKREQNIGFRFSGFIKIPTAGEYTFFTRSDDGSRLLLDGNLVVENDGIHAATEKSGSVQLKQGDHVIEVLYFNGGAGAELLVSMAGPGLKKQEIPRALLSTDKGIPMVPMDSVEFTVDPTKAAQGKELFISMGCSACHQTGKDNFDGKYTAKALKELNPASGCLAPEPPKGMARYALDSTQRAALQKTLAGREKLSKPREAAEQVAYTLTANNCLACHTRAGIGGPSRVRNDFFSVLGDVDLGDEGRMPPQLTGVGRKLRASWIRDVLVNKGSVRPYMATRMPQFGAANVETLAASFEKVDGFGAGDTALELADVKWGRKLVGTDGMSCISCHTFAGKKSLGIPAMDLTLMSKRLKPDWFHAYLLDPQSLRPGTRMPAFWPEGKSARQDILSGDTDRQINAIWAYLNKPGDAGLPPGLVQGKMELVADKEAVIYRNFIQGAGARAIGVGYPEKANLAFDANELRLAMLWQGPFIDAARHRTGRGEGFEPPLGYNVLKLPAGPAFAVLNEDSEPWPELTGRSARAPAGYKMLGYQLDDKQRPIFSYEFKDAVIEDYPVPVSGDIDPYFRRTLTVKSAQPLAHFWFRAWSGTKIDAKEDGSFMADGHIKIKLTSGAKPVVRRSGDRAELLVPVTFANGQVKIVEDIVW